MLFPNDDHNSGPPSFQSGPPPQRPLMDEEPFDGGMYYVDFGPFFGQEMQKILRFKRFGLMTEIVFWQGGFGY